MSQRVGGNLIIVPMGSSKSSKKSTVRSLQPREGKREPFPAPSTPATQTNQLLPKLHTSLVPRTLAGDGTSQTPTLITSPSPKSGYCTPGHWALSRRFRSFTETPRQSTRGAEEPLSLRPRRGAPPAAALPAGSLRPAVPSPQPGTAPDTEPCRPGAPGGQQG